jgi:hypothetical protein
VAAQLVAPEPPGTLNGIVDGTVYIPGEFASSDTIAWLDAFEWAIYAEEADRAARNEPPVPGVPAPPE